MRAVGSASVPSVWASERELMECEVQVNGDIPLESAQNITHALVSLLRHSRTSSYRRRKRRQGIKSTNLVVNKLAGLFPYVCAGHDRGECKARISDLTCGGSDRDLLVSWFDGHIHFKTDRFSIGDLKRDVGQVT